MNRRPCLGLGIMLVTLVVAPTQGYLKIGVSDGTTTRVASWPLLPIRYFVTDRAGGGLSAADLRGAIGRAVETWEAVPTSSVAFEFVGFTLAPPGAEDGLSTIGFLDRPDLERTLAVTEFLIDEFTGEIVESDIFFNTSVSWSVASGGEAGRFDLETVAVHEAGHLLGLSHSAIGETELRPDGNRRVTAAGTVMFPIAFAPGSIELRTLQPDDVAGASDLYPERDRETRTGTISGRITKNGRGVQGAHVVAFHLRTGVLVGNFTLDQDGTYAIGGLQPGLHLVRVEPLDDASITSFFEAETGIDLEFQVAYADRLATVPSGGGTRGVDIRVQPK